MGDGVPELQAGDGGVLLVRRLQHRRLTSTAVVALHVEEAGEFKR